MTTNKFLVYTRGNLMVLSLIKRISVAQRKRVSCFKESLLVAAVLGICSAFSPLWAQEYANWSQNGAGVVGSGGGTFTAAASMPDFTWTSVTTLAGGGLVETSATFSGTVGIETVYGEANSEDNLRLGSADNTVSDGSPINATNTLTITFDSATPASGWAFALLDLDDDQVLVSATDSSGNPVSTAVINSWFEGLFDPDPFDSGIDTAFWDVTGVPANTGVVVGNLLAGGNYTGLVGIPPGDNEAAAAWFSPNISLNSLILRFQPIDNEPGSGSTMHVYIASAHGVVGDYGDAPQSYDGTANAAARHSNPSSTLHLGTVQADTETGPPPWAPALGLADGDDTDGGDDEDGVSIFQDYISAGGMNCSGYTTNANEYCVVVVDVTNNSASDAQLVGWLDFGAGNGFDPDGTFSVAERSLPKLVAHNLETAGGGGTESVTNSVGQAFSSGCFNKTFNLTSSGSITDVLITVDIDHTWRSDLDITLTSPNSTTVNLTTDNGGGADNLYVTFDDAAATSITADNSNHSVNVTRRPEGTLSSFDGEDPVGIWTLEICDDYAPSDPGVFNSATLDVTSTGGASVPCNHSGITDNTYITGNVPAGCSGSATLLFTGLGDIDEQSATQTYARFRITTDTSFFSDASPSPTGAVSDGEVEDYELDSGALPVTLSHFDSALSGNKIKVDWSTSSELFNVGFQLWGLDGSDGQWEKLHNRLIRSGSGNAVEPQSYSKRVRIPKAINNLIALGISSVDADGSEHYYGPFEMGVSYGDLSSLESIDWNDIRAQADAKMARNGYVKDQGSGYRKASLSGESTVSGASATDAVVEFNINEDGLYRITSSDLLTGGIDLSAIANGEIALLNHQGESVVRYVLAKGKGRGLNKTLGDGGELYFYGQAPDESAGLYTDSSVYRLVVDSTKALDAPTQGKQGLKDSFSDQYIEHIVVENDAQYRFTSAADDPWVSRVVVGYTDQPSLYGIKVPVEADALWDQSSTLLLGLGRSSHLPGVDSDGDGAQDAEHIVEGLALDSNNALLYFGQHTAVGAGLWNVEFEIPGDTPLALTGGHVVIGGGFSAGAGYAFSKVHVDSIGLSYARPAVAKAGEGYLLFSAPNGGELGHEVTVPNHGSAVVFASDGTNLVRIMPESVKKGTSADGESQRRVKFAALQGIENVSDGGELKYWVSAKEKVLSVAGLSSRSIPTQASVLAQAQGADYVMIAHPAFIGEDSSGVDQLSSYAAFKQSQGYTVSMINYLDIVDSFGGGQAGPGGLTAYLDEAQAQGGIDNVLIVGGSTYDHTDILGTGAITFIPGHYGQSSYSNYTLSDVPYITDNEGGLFANIGRWPVRTMGDLGHIVDKSLVWGQSDHTSGETLLIAENTLAGENINFGAALDSVADILPSGWTSNKVYVDEILSANPGYTQAQAFTQARTEIVGHLNAVPELVLFNGHADTRQLSNNGLFKSSYVAQVTTPGAEVWVPLSCYVTYYESTHVNMLAHQLLFTGNAVAITGAMLLSDQSGNIAMGKAILGGAFNEGQTLGAAVNQGKARINNPQLDINWALLGDPTVSF